LEKMLTAMGYSERAVEEILKWYGDDGAKGNLHSSSPSKPRQKR